MVSSTLVQPELIEMGDVRFLRNIVPKIKQLIGKNDIRQPEFKDFSIEPLGEYKSSISGHLKAQSQGGN